MPPTPSNFLGSYSLVRKFSSQKTDRLGWLGLGDYDTDLNVDVHLVLFICPKTLLPKNICSTRFQSYVDQNTVLADCLSAKWFSTKRRGIFGRQGSFENPNFIDSE